MDSKFDQNIAILIDGNNIEMSIHEKYGDVAYMLNFDVFIQRILGDRKLSQLNYFREGKAISERLSKRLHYNFYGGVVPCHHSTGIPLTINALLLADKVNTIIVISGDADFIELIRHLKSRGVRAELAGVYGFVPHNLVKEADFIHYIGDEDVFKLDDIPQVDQGNAVLENDNNY